MRQRSASETFPQTSQNWIPSRTRDSTAVRRSISGARRRSGGTRSAARSWARYPAACRVRRSDPGQGLEQRPSPALPGRRPRRAGPRGPPDGLPHGVGRVAQCDEDEIPGSPTSSGLTTLGRCGCPAPHRCRSGPPSPDRRRTVPLPGSRRSAAGLHQLVLHLVRLHQRRLQLLQAGNGSGAAAAVGVGGRKLPGRRGHRVA